MADYKTSQNKLSTKIRNALIMPLEHRKLTTNLNLKRLIILDWILITAGIIMVALILANNLYHNENQISIIYFYASLSIISVFSIIWCFIFKNKVDLSPETRNLGLYISFIALVILCLIGFLRLFSVFPAFIYLACTLIIFSLVFYLEPIFYTIIIIAATSVVSSKIITILGLPSVLVVSLFMAIMIFLSFSRWSSTIKSINAKAEQDKYTNNLEKELTLASFVQKSFFPHNETEFDGWAVSFYSEAMAGISGDMFDVYNTESKLDGLGLFDVSGHGLSSGLVTMLVKNIIYQEFYQKKDKALQSVLNDINDRIIKEKGDIENFLTGTLVRINDNLVEFINAGNPQPIIFIKEKNNTFFYENTNQNHYGVIGMADFPVNYTSTTIKMNAGDEILFYTDGITENCNKNGLPFGKKLLLDNFKLNTFKTCKDQVSDLISSFKEYKGSFRSSDDVTVILLKKL